MMDSAQLINQTSGNVEWYTPLEIVEAARACMGDIDLDPASSVVANQRVLAHEFFDEASDGLKQQWHGRVWLNHPFGRGRNEAWINKLINEWFALRILSACCITFASTSEKWFRPLLDFPQCFIHGRTGYIMPDGTRMKGCTKGSVVTYLGGDEPAFHKAFHKLGTIKVRYVPR